MERLSTPKIQEVLRLRLAAGLFDRQIAASVQQVSGTCLQNHPRASPGTDPGWGEGIFPVVIRGPQGALEIDATHRFWWTSGNRKVSWLFSSSIIIFPPQIISRHHRHPVRAHAEQTTGPD